MCALLNYCHKFSENIFIHKQSSNLYNTYVEKERIVSNFGIGNILPFNVKREDLLKIREYYATAYRIL